MGKPAFIVAAVTAVIVALAMALSGCAVPEDQAAGEQVATESAGVVASTPVASSAVASSAAAVALDSPAVEVGNSGGVDSSNPGGGNSGVANVGAAGAPVTAVANAGTTGVPDSSIVAQATGTISGTPDVVTVVIGVQTQSASAQTALDDNNKRAADVIAVLKESGVAPADLQTSQLSVNPSYDEKGQLITGYQVTNMVTAKLRDISTAGAVIDAAGKTAGDAVRVQQLSFSIDDDSALRAEARADAVKRAQAQAKQMADAAGIQLGAIRSITETPVAMPAVYPSLAAADSAAGSVPIEPGSQELSVVVQVVYAIAG
ncbi:MAG TPA: SIMPL domain-containing protein [Nakamurella sp.]